MIVLRIRWRRVSRQEWQTIAAVLIAQVTIGVALRLFPVASLSRAIESLRSIAARAVRVPEERVAWAIEGVGRRLPWISTCLVRALAADLFLSAPGRTGHVKIGVRRSAGGALQSHAWFEREGRILVGAVGTGAYVHFLTLHISRPHQR